MGASTRSLGLWARIALRRTVMPRGIAFLCMLGAISGAGAEVVFCGVLLLLAGVPVYVWVRWRALVPADAITDGAGGAR